MKENEGVVSFSSYFTPQYNTKSSYWTHYSIVWVDLSLSLCALYIDFWFFYSLQLLCPTSVTVCDDGNDDNSGGGSGDCCYSDAFAALTQAITAAATISAAVRIPFDLDPFSFFLFVFVINIFYPGEVYGLRFEGDCIANEQLSCLPSQHPKNCVRAHAITVRPLVQGDALESDVFTVLLFITSPPVCCDVVDRWLFDLTCGNVYAKIHDNSKVNNELHSTMTFVLSLF